MEYILDSDNLSETEKIGRMLARAIEKEQVILLQGEMSAGKTTLTQSILRQFGVEGYITSPTYTVVNEYESEEGEFFHFDLYRLESEEELYDIGFEEYIDRGLCIIEWPERANDLFEQWDPNTLIKVSLQKKSTAENGRTIKVEAAPAFIERLETFWKGQNL